MNETLSAPLTIDPMTALPDGIVPTLALSMAQVPLWNALVAMENQAVGVAGVMIVYRQVPRTAADRFRHRIVWRDGLAEACVAVALETFAFAETHAADITAETLGVLPAEMSRLLERSALDLVLDRLARAGLSGRAIDAGTPDAGGPAAGRIEAVVELHGLFSTPVAIRLCGAPRDLLALVDLRALMTLRASPDLATRIRLPARVELAPLVLPASDVAGLATGDLVVLDETRTQQRLFLVTEQARHVLSAHEQTWMIREMSMSNDDLAAEAEERDLAEAALGASDGPPSPADLPVRVHFELASLDLPIAEIAGWTEGSIVDVGLGALSAGLPVTVRVGGERLASGNLVLIDDRFAVRIARLAGGA